MTQPKYEVGDLLRDIHFTSDLKSYEVLLLILAHNPPIECYTVLCLHTGQVKKEIYAYYDSYAGIQKVA
jgi:hypothetical protein